MELTTASNEPNFSIMLFMITKIQKLNGTHNGWLHRKTNTAVVYDYKDTKIEWNSQLLCG